MNKNMRKTVSGLLSATVLLSVSAGMPILANASTGGHSQEDAVAWATAQNGKYLDYDGAYGAQCVDLIMCYYDYLGCPIPGGNACDYCWNDLPDGWMRIPNDTGYTPEPGDVCVWDAYAGSSGEYGHVGIVTGGDSTTISTMEQNVDGSATRSMSRNTSLVTCFIRPDFDIPAPEPVISFRSNGGTAVEPIKVSSDGTYGTLPVPEKENAEFLGWSLSDNQAYSMDFTEDTPVYFKRPANWEGTKIYCFVWNVFEDYSLYDWEDPSSLCEMVGRNIYKYVIPAGESFSNIIFSDGCGNQIYDLALGSCCANDMVVCTQYLGEGTYGQTVYEASWKVHSELPSTVGGLDLDDTFPYQRHPITVSDTYELKPYHLVTADSPVALPYDHTLYAVWKNDELVNTSEVENEKIVLGNQVKVNIAAEGGSAPYRYEVFYQHSGQSKWTTAPVSGNTSVFKPKSTGTYTVSVKITDAAGTVVRKRFTVSVSSALKNTSTLSAETVKKGGTLTVNASATGGAGGYQYAVWFKQAAKTSWITAQNYSTNNTISFKPQATGLYDISVKVKDKNGKIVKKAFSVTVTGPLVNQSVLSSTSVKKGEGVTVNAAATGGAGGYQYAVWYKQAAKTSWNQAQNYSENTTIVIKPRYSGSYDISVKVKDQNGTIVKKAFKVTFTEPLTNKSTISAVSVPRGESMQIKCAAVGGTAPYQYAVYYQKNGDTSWRTLQNFKANDKIEFKPLYTSVYKLSVKVKDADGTVVRKYLQFNCVDLV